MKILDHLDKLPVFLAVAEHGTALGPAKALGLSQPSVSRSIQSLEQALGFDLFTRSRSGMALTDGGKIFAETAARIVKDAMDAAERGAHAQEEMAGQITIGTFESLSEYLWPNFLAKVQREFPRLQVSLKTNSQAEHQKNLNAGTLDLLVDAEPRDYTGLTQWFLYSDRFAFFTGKKLSEELDPETAARWPLLTVRGVFDEKNITIEDHLRGQRYFFPRTMTFDSFTTVKKMAAKGLGLAVLPVRLTESGAGEEKVYPAKLAGFPREGFGQHRIFATVSSHREKDKRVKALVSMLKKQLL